MCILCKENVTPEQTIGMLKKTLSDNTEQTFQTYACDYKQEWIVEHSKCEGINN